MKIFTFEAWHAASIDLQEAQKDQTGFFTPEELEAVVGDAITVVHNGTILLCGGRQKDGDHYVLWALVSKHAGPYMLSLTRIVKRAMEITHGEKVIYVHQQFKEAQRWANILGLRFERVGNAPMPDRSLPFVYTASERSLTAMTNLALDLAKANGQVNCPVEHHFCDGTYTRKLTIPAGTLVIGKVHKRRTMNICASGRIAILTADGPREFKAGDVVMSEPGIQKVGYAIEETVWVNVWATEETDLDFIEATFAEDPRVPIDAVDFMKQLEAA
jgi:hypothetical protein